MRLLKRPIRVGLSKPSFTVGEFTRIVDVVHMVQLGQPCFLSLSISEAWLVLP